jgi:serine/threonine protein kinase
MSVFLPKYYINVERNADSEHQLMCDYIPFPTLADYTTKNRDTLSYQTKIYLGYIIAQGLRYLQEYQIAHLDLKPSNIMLFKRMMIKLIDFGESYHPDIKGTPSITQIISPASQFPTLPQKTISTLRTTTTKTTSFPWESSYTSSSSPGFPSISTILVIGSTYTARAIFHNIGIILLRVA